MPYLLIQNTRAHTHTQSVLSYYMLCLSNLVYGASPPHAALSDLLVDNVQRSLESFVLFGTQVPCHITAYDMTQCDKCLLTGLLHFTDGQMDGS